jgi:hypothetical protein
LSETLITALLLAASTAINALLQMWRDLRKDRRDDRDRAWERQDRKEKAEALASTVTSEAARVASGLASTVTDTAARLEELTQRRTGQVLARIAENTAISTEAFKEANAVNSKLLQVHKRIDKFTNE